MSYFYSDVTQGIFLPSNTLPQCDEKFEVDLSDKHLNFLREKAALYDSAIAEANSRFYQILDLIKNYYVTHDKDNNYKIFKILSDQFNSIKEDDQHFFTACSTSNYFVDNTFVNIKYLDMVNEIVDDFNTNYYEYYLMAQHAEQYNCCFIFTFRKVSKFLSRTINCQFFYCHFDGGVNKYISDLNSLKANFQTTTVTNNDGSTTESIKNSDQVSNNLNVLKDYLTKRTEFKNDLQAFYDKIFEFLSDYVRFFVHLKFLIKVMSIASIIVNAHSDDADLFQEHSNTLINLVQQGTAELLPATQRYYFGNLAYIFQEDIVPNLIDMKVALEKDKSLTLNEKTKVKNLMLLMAISAAGLIEKCQNLYSKTTTYLTMLTLDKVTYFAGLTEEKREQFEVKAYIDDKRINPCYVIDYNNPPTPAELEALREKLGITDTTTNTTNTTDTTVSSTVLQNEATAAVNNSTN